MSEMFDNATNTLDRVFPQSVPMIEDALPEGYVWRPVPIANQNGALDWQIVPKRTLPEFVTDDLLDSGVLSGIGPDELAAFESVGIVANYSFDELGHPIIEVVSHYDR